MNDLLTWAWGSTPLSTGLSEPWLGTTEAQSLSRKEPMVPAGRDGCTRARQGLWRRPLPTRPRRTRASWRSRSPRPALLSRSSEVGGTRPVASEGPAELSPFFRAHILPPFTKFLTPLRRKAPKPALPLSDRLLPLQRQPAEPLESLPELLASFRLELLPPVEILPGFHPLLGRHGKPALGPVAETLLPLRRELIPAIREGFEHPLLLAAQLLKRHPRTFHLRPCGQRRNGQNQREEPDYQDCFQHPASHLPRFCDETSSSG